MTNETPMSSAFEWKEELEKVEAERDAMQRRAEAAEEEEQAALKERDAALALILKAYQFNNQQDLGVPADGWDDWQREAKALLSPKEPTKLSSSKR